MVVLTSLADRRTVELRPSTFGKLLYLARLQGWQPERIPETWPSTSWDTTIVLPEVEPYRQGLVSKNDARSIAGALDKLVAFDSAGLDAEVCTAARQFINLMGRCAFLVRNAVS